jgi:sporulation protein YlmC with PRC-barrel domain
MKVLNAFAVVAAFGLLSVACAQPPPQPPETTSRTDLTASLSERWVSALIRMNVETPAGARLGTVRDVVVDGYGRATYAIISYGGVMGLGDKYTAVPWATVAEMLRSDRLLVDRSQLENAPVLSGAKPDSANTSWRPAADDYWRGKVVALALGPAAIGASTDAGASAPERH